MKLQTLAPNHCTITKDEVTTFFSYDTPILSMVDGTVTLHPAWNYSATTSRHRSTFLGESTRITKDKLQQGIYTLKDFDED